MQPASLMWHASPRWVSNYVCSTHAEGDAIMTDYQLKRRAINNFKTFTVPKETQRNYQRQWLRCVTQLGDRWLYAQQLQKGTTHV